MMNSDFFRILLVLASCCCNAVAFSSARTTLEGISMLTGGCRSSVFTSSERNNYDDNKLAFHRQRVVAASTTDEESGATAVVRTIESHLIVGCFGRLADKSFVVSPSDVEGTAASGYEFGVLESGRPKWICTYTSQTGATQGGGAPMTHIPNWLSVLFDDQDDAGLTKEKLAAVLQNENTKFEMPLGASPMTKQKAAMTFSDDDCNQIVERIWELLCSGGDSCDVLSKNDVSEGLAAVASDFGSNSDSMTYSVFEKAMKA